MPFQTLSNILLIDYAHNETYRLVDVHSIEAVPTSGVRPTVPGASEDGGRPVVIVPFDGDFGEDTLADPESVTEITATDEDGDPIRYTVDFEGRRETIDGLGAGFVWRVVETEHPHPDDAKRDDLFVSSS